MNSRRRAMLAAAIGATVLLAPTTAIGAGKPTKPGPCVVSNGVSVVATKVKGVTTITVTGTSGWDNIDCSAATSRVVVHGMGVASGNIGDTIYGGSRNDDLHAEGTGSARTDYVIGNGGNDTIHAGGPNVTAIAMGDDFNPNATVAGNDTIVATGGFVQFYGGAGDDVLDVAAATGSAVEGNVGNDRILGSPGHDALYGGSGDDILTDYAGNTETFDCGDGAADILNDFDGNGTGLNGAGWRSEADDDSHVGCESVWIDDTAPCPFTAGTSGCVLLDGVVAYTGNTGSGTTYTTLSGSFVFSPITDWDFFTNGTASGSGTWTSSTGTSGTWTAHDETPTQIYYPRFSDASGPTTCALATTRYVGVELSLAGGGLASDAILSLEIRVATTGTNYVFYQAFSATPTGEPLGLHSGLDVSGVTIAC